MKKLSNPIISATNQFDPFQFYRSPLSRTMAGYKFLSGTFLLCGSLAVPALLHVGESGINGAIAIGVASILPISIQTLFVPRYVARMSIEDISGPSTAADTTVPVSDRKSKSPARGLKTSMKASSAPIDVLDQLVPQTTLRIDYFTLFGPLRTKIEAIGDIKGVRSFRWTNWKSRSGMTYYVDKQAAGPILKKIMKMIEEPEKPETWRTY